MKTVGDYWTLAIVQAVGSHQRRFCELERLLPGSNPVTLTSRLKDMERMRLLTRTRDPKNKVCVTYALTDHGRQLVPIAVRIRKFAEGYLA